MKLFKRLVVSFLYSIPFLGIHIFLGCLLFNDPKTLEVIKNVGYISLGLYVGFIVSLSVLVVVALGLMSIRHLFGLKSKEKITD